MSTETEPKANPRELLDTMLGYLGFVSIIGRLGDAPMAANQSLRRFCTWVPGAAASDPR